MKETVIKFGQKEFKVRYEFKEDYNQTVIYELKNGTPSPKILGSDLKSACKIWFLSLDGISDISNISQKYDVWLFENKFKSSTKNSFEEFLEKLTPMQVTEYFNEFLDSLDEVQLFIDLAPNENFTYVNWNEIEEVM